MTYEKLAKLFYKLDEPAFEDEYTKRISSYGSMLTSLEIRAFRKGTLQTLLCHDTRADSTESSRITQQRNNTIFDRKITEIRRRTLFSPIDY